MDTLNDVIKALISFGWEEEEAKKTWERWYNWLTEIGTKKDYTQHFKAIQKLDFDQLITYRNIDVFMACPHHLLPVEMKVDVSYKPAGIILGASKFARIAKDMANPMTQEAYTKKIVGIIMKELKPKWCMAKVTGKHSCMRCRGVGSINSEMITTSIDCCKEIRDSSETFRSLKSEFMKIVNGIS